MHKKSLRPRAADILLFAAVILLALVLMWALSRGDDTQLTAVVTLDGRELCRTQLSGLTEPVRIHADGEFSAVVVLTRDGVYIEQSSCPGGDCVASGSIDRAGQSLVCLPNRLTVTLEGPDEAVDAYTG